MLCFQGRNCGRDGRGKRGEGKARLCVWGPPGVRPPLSREPDWDVGGEGELRGNRGRELDCAGSGRRAAREPDIGRPYVERVRELATGSSKGRSGGAGLRVMPSMV